MLMPCFQEKVPPEGGVGFVKSAEVRGGALLWPTSDLLRSELVRSGGRLAVLRRKESDAPPPPLVLLFSRFSRAMLINQPEHPPQTSSIFSAPKFKKDATTGNTRK